MRPVPSIVILWPVTSAALDSILARAVASAAVRNVRTGDGRRRLYFNPEALERRFLGAARRLLERLAEQDEAIDRAASICADAIGADGSSTSSAPATRGSRSRSLPALMLVPGFHPIIELDDQPHAGGGSERPAPGDVHRAGRGSGRGDPRQLRPGAAGRHARLQPRGRDRRPRRDRARGARARPAGDRGHVVRARRRRPSPAPRRVSSTTPTSCSTSAPRRATRWSPWTGSPPPSGPAPAWPASCSPTS